MYQRISLPILFVVICCFASCDGKNKTSNENPDFISTDTNATKQTENQISKSEVSGDTTLSTIQPIIEKELTKWVQSFKNFHIDSFHQVTKSGFQENDYGDIANMDEFYSFYKPSLSFSPDSSQFLDLYSNGIRLLQFVGG